MKQLTHDFKGEAKADPKTRVNQMALFGNNNGESHKSKSGNPENLRIDLCPWIVNFVGIPELDMPKANVLGTLRTRNYEENMN